MRRLTSALLLAVALPAFAQDADPKPKLTVVPFALLNLVCALVGMRMGPFVGATFLGIIPGAVVFASIGAGLGHVLEAGQTPDLSVVVSWPVLGPLLMSLAVCVSLGAALRTRLGATPKGLPVAEPVQQLGV